MPTLRSFRSAAVLLLASAAALALSSCTSQAGAQGTSSNKIDVGTAASETLSPAAKKCEEASKSLGAVVTGLSVDASASTYTEPDALSCTWTSQGAPVAGLTFAVVDKGPGDVIDPSNPLQVSVNLNAPGGSALLLGREGTTVAEAGTVTLVLQGQELTLSATGAARDLAVGQASPTEAAQALYQLGQTMPSK